MRTHQVERDLVAELPEGYRDWPDALEPFLLADDSEITDETILLQIKRGG